MSDRHLRAVAGNDGANGDGSTTSSRARSDGWSTDDGGYSVDNFYTASVDKGDRNHATVQFAIPTSVKHAIEALVQSKRVPHYDTTQAFLRDAVYHRLKWAEKGGYLRAVDRRMLDEMLAFVSQAQIREAQVSRKKALKTLEDNLDEAAVEGDVEELAAIFEAAEAMVQNAGSKKHAERVQAVLARYKHLLGGRDG